MLREKKLLFLKIFILEKKKIKNIMYIHIKEMPNAKCHFFF